MDFLPPKPKKLLKPQIKPECFNSRNWEALASLFASRGQCPQLCYFTSDTLRQGFPVTKFSSMLGGQTEIHDGRCSLCRIFETPFKQFPDQVSNFQMTYLTFQLSFFLFQLLYFAMERPSRKIILFLNIPSFRTKKCCFLTISSNFFCYMYLWKHPYFSFQ